MSYPYVCLVNNADMDCADRYLPNAFSFWMVQFPFLLAKSQVEMAQSQCFTVKLLFLNGQKTPFQTTKSRFMFDSWSWISSWNPKKKRLVKYAIFDGFIPIIDCESQFLTVKFIFSMVYPNFWDLNLHGTNPIFWIVKELHPSWFNPY